MLALMLVLAQVTSQTPASASSGAAAVPQSLHGEIAAALNTSDRNRLLRLFEKEEHAQYLFEMASRRGGLRNIKVTLLPKPPGWEGAEQTWAVFHTAQYIQADHDPVYPLLPTPSGLRLGPEIPEYATDHVRIRHARLDADLHPARSQVDVEAVLTLTEPEAPRAPVFRLNSPYTVAWAQLDGKTARVIVADGPAPEVREGDVVRAGSLLIPWSKEPIKQASFRYSAVLDRGREDHISDKVGYVTAWWVPSLARLPHTTTTRITGPAAWVLRSEGEPVSQRAAGFESDKQPGSGQQVVAFKCDLPISFPKVMGGRYLLAAEGTDNGKNYRVWHLDRIERGRAQHDLQRMIEFVRFCEEKLIPFPFSGYECFDGENYYGIESYSHTLLSKGITSRYVAHEIGHTYFGGIAPSAYVKDSWNEGVTTYVDDVLTGRHVDRPLEAGLATVNLDIPLTQMPRPHLHNSATYMRGAYVMKMLEYEIGPEKVLEGLRLLLRDRVGKDTTWPDLRQYFEKAGNAKLDWFWEQWIAGSRFPTLSIMDHRSSHSDNEGFTTAVTVRQSDVPSPFRMRFAIRLAAPGQHVEELLHLTTQEHTFTIQSPFRPSEVRLVVLPYTLARIR
jgi:hypothetical protein